MHGLKRLFPGGWQKVFHAVPQKVLFPSGMAQKKLCVGCHRRRRKASGRVVTCPEGWMALKRKPRNRALFALCCIGLICKIEAGLGQVSVGKKCSASGED